MNRQYDFSIQNLGKPEYQSPIILSRVYGDTIANYVTDDERILSDIQICNGKQFPQREDAQSLEKAGPRERIYFSPSEVRAGIVTCGGLCPGLNDVIRSVVHTLWHSYGARKILGIKFGYNGFLGAVRSPVIALDPDAVKDIHRIGGSILGTSRGGGEQREKILNAVEKLGLNMLFTIGGDGTQKGALGIAEEAARRGKKIAVIGIPKTIDNDLSFVEKSFGFETAVVRATEVVLSAHQEAHSAIHGIGLVKLMGRESGFIAAHTAISSQDVNYALIPEVPFRLEGSGGLFEHLTERLDKRNHAVIIVAEGAGQNLLHDENASDASGNRKLGDIGIYIKELITKYFKDMDYEVNLKYIDPSYIIRSSSAIPTDGLYCSRLGTNAVHAAMTGKTAMLVSFWNSRFVHVPMKLSCSMRNYVNPESSLWRDVLDATGMPLTW